MLSIMDGLELTDLINLMKRFSGNTREMGEFVRLPQVMEAAVKRARKLIAKNKDIKINELLA